MEKGQQYWSNSYRAAACGQPLQAQFRDSTPSQFGKDRREPSWSRGTEGPWGSSTDKVLGTDHSPLPCSLCCRRGRKEGGWGEGYFSLLLVLADHVCQQQIMNYINNPHAESVLPVTVVVEWSPHPYLTPWALCHCVFFPVPFVEGESCGEVQLPSRAGWKRCTDETAFFFLLLFLQIVLLAVLVMAKKFSQWSCFYSGYV